jgi:hypothetical protein
MPWIVTAASGVIESDEAMVAAAPGFGGGRRCVCLKGSWSPVGGLPAAVGRGRFGQGASGMAGERGEKGEAR